LKHWLWILFIGLSIVAQPALAQRKQPTLTPMELQALQSREFEADRKSLFASVMSVLQDLGYTIDSADLGTGFITASSPTTNKTNFFEAFGGVLATGNSRVTAFVEEMASGLARVRLNFVNTRHSSSSYGQQHKQDRPVLDPKTYQAAWEKIDEALFVRSALAPSSAAGASSERMSAAAPDEPAQAGVVVAQEAEADQADLRDSNP
jgi:hypothetical protein